MAYTDDPPHADIQTYELTVREARPCHPELVEGPPLSDRD